MQRVLHFRPGMAFVVIKLCLFNVSLGQTSLVNFDICDNGLLMLCDLLSQSLQAFLTFSRLSFRLALLLHVALLELLKGVPGHALVWLLTMLLLVGILSRESLVQLLGKLESFIILGSLLPLFDLASLLLLVEPPGQTLLPFSKMR